MKKSKRMPLIVTGGTPHAIVWWQYKQKASEYMPDAYTFITSRITILSSMSLDSRGYLLGFYA